MTSNHKVTIIHEDGLIVKEDSNLFEKKSAEQILQIYHPKDFDNFVLGIRTPTYIEIIRPNLIPFERYPLLKMCNSDSDYEIPKLSLCILNDSEKEKSLFVLQPVDENMKDIQFPPFVYGFSRKDLTKQMSKVKNEIGQFFGLEISNIRIFLDDTEEEDCTVQKFVEVDSKKPNLNKIYLKFTLGEKGKKILIKRQRFVKEMVSVIRNFCGDIIQFLNQVGKNAQEAGVFTEFEYNTIFGSIIDMFHASTRLITALSGNESYDSFIGNILYKFIPDLETSFKDFFANYQTKELIPEILKKYQNSKLLKSIMQQTFGKETISFDSMAIIPIQILPRYKLLFINIMKTTPRSHPEYLLFQKDISQLDCAIKNLENYKIVRDISKIQNRIYPFDMNGKTLLKKYNVNFTLISKGSIYLLNDLIVITKGTNSHEIEKCRFKYDEFIFFPNLASCSIVYYYNNQFETIKFQSNIIMKNMIENVARYRLKAIESNPEKNNSLIASEIILKGNQFIPPMIDSSCYKINNLIVVASSGVFMTYKIHNQSLNALRKVRNIHPYAKLVGVDNEPYIYGGEKFPLPFEFSNYKLLELKPIFNLNEQPEAGRIFHTCCSYNNYIVIFGGYNIEKKNQKTFTNKVYLVNVKTGQWFMSKPGDEVEPEARYKHSAVIYKNLMIIHGGISCQTNQVLDDTWFFNFNDGKWSTLKLNQNNNNVVVPRFGHSAVMVNQYMFIIGGLTNPQKCEQSNADNTTLNDTSIGDDDSSYDEALNNFYVPAQNFFCLDIESCRLFGVNLVGNFLPGLSMFSSIYDENSKQILVFGGQYQNNKEEKNTSICIRLSIPSIFTSSTIPNGNDIKSIGSRMKRKMSVGVIRKNDIQNLRNEIKSATNIAMPQPSTPGQNKVAFLKLFYENNGNDKEQTKN